MLLTTHANSVINQVTVTTSARLHMGFYDLTNSSARLFGSLGLAIDAPCTRIKIMHSKKLNIDAKSSENIAEIVKKLVTSLNLPENFSVKVQQAMPEHAGLGSGTQMALAIGAGLNQLFNLNLNVIQIAKHAQRGSRSGIGIAAFEQGGFLLDVGKNSGKYANNENGEIPAISARLDFPTNWRVLLVQDMNYKGVHGAAELQAFQSLPAAQHTLRDMVQAHMLPALQRLDLLAFGAYMQDLQAYNGDYFAPVQGGRYASQDVADVLAWLQTNGAACVGQSSWGPTGFAILETSQQAKSLQTKAQFAFAARSNISFSIVRGKNTGANIQLG